LNPTGGLDVILMFMGKTSGLELFVIGVLSIYFIAIFWVFIYRFISLSILDSSEKRALESRFKDTKALGGKSVLDRCLKSGRPISKELLDVCKTRVSKEATAGLTFLSIVASTAPFIGLFGTIVKILDAFAKLGVTQEGTLNAIAPVISEALIATAAGILVAIPAYSFHLIIRRRAYEVVNTVEMHISLILSKKE